MSGASVRVCVYSPQLFAPSAFYLICPYCGCAKIINLLRKTHHEHAQYDN